MSESWASSEHVRRTMTANKRRDTAPELKIRSGLHRKGLRFRIDAAPLEGFRRRADIVFTRARVAVFIDGCFWHGCPKHFIAPKTNADYWQQKIRKNMARDKDTNERLEEAGWVVLRFWEHEEPNEAVSAIVSTWRDRANCGS